MKYMRLGTKPDTFHTVEASRTVTCDAPNDLVIRVNNTTFVLHKFSVLPKCGLLQRLCCDSLGSSAASVTIELNDIPGGEDAFDICAKFCYGIAIDISAHNFVFAFCAAKFLEMTETVGKGNLITKLEAFFHSCILPGWKDSLVVLQSTGTLPEWSENLGIIRRCIDSIIEKILTPPSKVKWSYTYTRPGYAQEQRQSAPRDWWTEDISNLNVDIFQCVIGAIRLRNMLPPRLIGEALHVYASCWLSECNTRTRSSWSWPSRIEADSVDKNLLQRRVVETIVPLIPAEEGSVSVGFLIRLLRIGKLVRVSPVTKAELVRRSSLLLEEATPKDLLRPAYCLSTNQYVYDIDLVKEVLQGYLDHWRRRQTHGEGIQLARSIRRVGELIDTYLQVVAKDGNVPVSEIVSLAEALPDAARPRHDDLYKAINIYLEEHPNLTKEGKKQLCRVLDCHKLSPEIRAHVVKNEQLPLRTVVQVLFVEQESGTSVINRELPPEQPISRERTLTTMSRDGISSKLRPGNMSEGQQSYSGRSLEKSQLKLGEIMTSNRQLKGANMHRGKEIEEEEIEEEEIEAAAFVGAAK